MQEKFSTSNEHESYKALSVIATAMISGILAFLLAAVFINYFRDFFVSNHLLAKNVSVITLITVVLMMMIAPNIYKRKIENLKNSNDTANRKLESFRIITIIHLAICELPAIISIILFLFFGHFLLLLPVGILLAEMIRIYPAKRKVNEIINSVNN